MRFYLKIERKVHLVSPEELVAEHHLIDVALLVLFEPIEVELPDERVERFLVEDCRKNNRFQFFWFVNLEGLAVESPTNDTLIIRSLKGQVELPHELWDGFLDEVLVEDREDH